MLGRRQITSKYDPRLWSLSGGYRDANASVALPPDAHGNSDAGPEGDERLGLPDAPLFPASMPWQIQVAYMSGMLGHRMMTPPIWEVVPDRVVKADSTRAGTAVSE